MYNLTAQFNLYLVFLARFQGYDIIGRPEERKKVMPLQHARRG